MKGNLVSLRALEPGDISVLYQWENDPEVWKVSNTLTPYSKYILQKYIETAHLDIYIAKQQRFVITRNEDGKPVGTIDLFDFDAFNQRAGLGILIYDKDDRGRGFASEALDLLIEYAFQTLVLHQVYCCINSDNDRSLQFFEGKGFRQTGVKKDWLRTYNGWKDEITLQLLNEQ